MRGKMRTRRVILALLAVVCVVGAVSPAMSAQDMTGKHVVRLTFDKSAVEPGVWRGTVAGDISGDLETRLLAAAPEGPILHVIFDWIVDAGDRSFTARLGGTLNTDTGKVKMGGSIIEGWQLGALVKEQGQLVDPATSRFVGTIRIKVSRASG